VIYHHTLSGCFLRLYTCNVVCVAWNGVLSDYFLAVNGVKQGGVLRPIIFSMYINGLLIIVLLVLVKRVGRRAVLPIESTSGTPHRGICIISIVSSSTIPVSATFVKSHPIVSYRKVGRNFGLSSLRRNDRGYTQWRRPHICLFVICNK